MFVACCTLCDVRFVLIVFLACGVCCMFVVCRVLFASRCLMLVVRRLFFVDGCLVFDACWSLVVVCGSLCVAVC